MGTENLFHKRKARAAEMLRREKAKRDPYARVLIVCEGTKTEPYYFGCMRNKLGLNRANVVISDKNRGLDPKSLVEYAIAEFKKDPDFNHIYCVFDQDKHSTYQSALDKIRSVPLKGGAQIHAITSIPCFEFWLLLHFTYTTRQYCAPLDDSNCDLVVSELQRYIPEYTKGIKDIFSYISNRTEEAIQRAKQLESFHTTSGTNNPSTKVYQIVEYLKRLQDEISC